MPLIRKLNQNEPPDEGHGPPLASDRFDLEGRQAKLARIQDRVLRELVAKFELSFGEDRSPAVRDHFNELFNSTLDSILVAANAEVTASEKLVLDRREKTSIHEFIDDFIFGFGPLGALLRDDSITEIMVNRFDKIFVDRKGFHSRVDSAFDSEDQLLKTLNRMLAVVGERLEAPGHPIVNTYFPDGSRLHAITIPVSEYGTVLTFYKFKRLPLTLEDLQRFGMITPDALEFLQAGIAARLNIVVASAGRDPYYRSALLNILATLIPSVERIITVESHFTQLSLDHEQVVSLIWRPMEDSPEKTQAAAG